MADKLVRLVNLTNSEYGITCNDGEYLDLGPFVKNSNIHISKPVLEVNLPKFVTKPGGSLARGELKKIDA